jgi:hypothetical protein
MYTLFADLTARLRGRRAPHGVATTVITGLLALFALSLPARAEDAAGPDAGAVDTSPVVARLDGTNATAAYALNRAWKRHCRITSTS